VSERNQVLVVEDNPANQLLAAAVLELEGIEVQMAGTPSEAIELVKLRLPALILMDLQLPGRNGLDLARQFKDDPRTAAIPIVALTANAMNGDREASLAAGCDGYISKPIDTRTFGALVRKFLPEGP
jgi:CheY-like chemotaxis protein